MARFDWRELIRITSRRLRFAANRTSGHPGGFNSTINVQTPPNDTWTSILMLLWAVIRQRDAVRSGGRSDAHERDVSDGDTNGLFNIVDRGFQYRPDVGVNITQPLLRNSWTDVNRTAIKVNKQLVRIADYLFQFQVMTQLIACSKPTSIWFLRRKTSKSGEGARARAAFARRKQEAVEIGTLAPLDEKQSESQRPARWRI